MAKLLKPPKPFEDIGGIVGSVFLAGSIEEGTAENWQDIVWKGLKDIPGLGVLNPRRDNWNASWEQSIKNNKFVEQVEWELSGIESVDVVAIYFAPKTKSPITLMELGILSHRFTNFSPEVIVCCPAPFWRKGNVDIVCRRYGHKQTSSLNELVEELRKKFDYLNHLSNDFDTENCKIGWSTSSKKGKNV